MEDKIIFKNFKIDFRKLLQLGFVEEGDHYKFDTQIMDDQFSLTVKINKNQVVNSDVIEIATNENFTLYNVASAKGGFVGKLREEYNNVIDKVKNFCCSVNIFKSEYANLIIEYVRNKYNDELEYLWEKFPNNAVWRNKVNRKWYGILLTVDKSKIGIKEEGNIEIIDLLLQKERVEKMVDQKRYFTAYHMNKKHWITIKLDGSVNIKEIYELIDNSYNLSKSKR